MVGPNPTADRPHSDEVAVGAQSVYDAVAEAYDRQFADELDGKPLDRAILTAFVELIGEGTVADVGCGPGHVTRYLAGHHSDVVGIDLSPGMIAVARAHAPDLSFTVGSMLSLPARLRGPGQVLCPCIRSSTSHQTKGQAPSTNSPV